MPEAGEDIETTMLPLKGASPFNIQQGAFGPVQALQRAGVSVAKT
jgi:hypothetical protein